MKREFLYSPNFNYIFHPLIIHYNRTKFYADIITDLHYLRTKIEASLNPSLLQQENWIHEYERTSETLRIWSAPTNPFPV